MKKLNEYWWHRLFQVVLVILSIIIFLVSSVLGSAMARDAGEKKVATYVYYEDYIPDYLELHKHDVGCEYEGKINPIFSPSKSCYGKYVRYEYRYTNWVISIGIGVTGGAVVTLIFSALLLLLYKFGVVYIIFGNKKK